MASEARLDAKWASLSAAAKKDILYSPADDECNPDMWREIARHLSDSPAAFYALAGTSRTIRDAIGTDFYFYADPKCLHIWATRLCTMLNRAMGKEVVHILHSSMSNAKMRYIRIVKRDGSHLATIDKQTGLILNFEHTRAAGPLVTRDPLAYYVIYSDLNHPWARLKMHAEMLEDDSKYVAKNNYYMHCYHEATRILKIISSTGKKRSADDALDEGLVFTRNQRFRGDQA